MVSLPIIFSSEITSLFIHNSRIIFLKRCISSCLVAKFEIVQYMLDLIVVVFIYIFLQIKCVIKLHLSHIV